MGKFRIGTKVNIVSGLMKGSSGIIKESKDFSNGAEYHIILDGESEERIYYEHNLEFENILAMEIESDELSGVLGKWDGFAPDSVNIDNADYFFMEMAEIYPKYNDDYNIRKIKFRVCIFEKGEGPVPHIHVFFEHKEDKNHGKDRTVAYICLGSNEYAPQHDKETKVLNSKERKALVTFFNTYRKGAYISGKDGNPIPANCWQECVDRWIQNNYDSEKYFKIDEETGLYVMPDYSEIHFPKSKKTNAKTESTESGDIMNENILDMEIDDYEYLGEMATITRDIDRKGNILIAVNPERDRLSIPYFKVYDSDDILTAKRVIRLHFKDSGMEYHKDKYKEWVLNADDKKHIIRVLKKTSKRFKAYTNWQYMCFQWNYENNLIDDDITAYFNGDYDKKYENHPNSALKEAYVPSTQKMPDTWIYDSSKGKRK